MFLHCLVVTTVSQISISTLCRLTLPLDVQCPFLSLRKFIGRDGVTNRKPFFPIREKKGHNRPHRPEILMLQFGSCVCNDMRVFRRVAERPATPELGFIVSTYQVPCGIGPNRKCTRADDPSNP